VDTVAFEMGAGGYGRLRKIQMPGVM
jgi:hypothetical protein